MDSDFDSQSQINYGFGLNWQTEKVNWAKPWRFGEITVCLCLCMCMLYVYNPEEPDVPKPIGVQMGHERLKIKDTAVVHWRLKGNIN